MVFYNNPIIYYPIIPDSKNTQLFLSENLVFCISYETREKVFIDFLPKVCLVYADFFPNDEHRDERGAFQSR